MPKTVPNTRYEMMVTCWHICPDTRPCFRNIATSLQNILENREEYLEMNPDRVFKEQSDIVNNNVYHEYVDSHREKDPLLITR